LLRKSSLVAVAGLVLAAVTPVAQAHAQPSLATVLSHTRAADRALDRAVTEFNNHALAAGRSDFGKNRYQMGQAVAEKAELIQNAATAAQRLAAAKALVAVAKQAGVDELAFARVDRVLPRGSRLQLRVMRAAGVDTARSVALAQLNDLLASVPAAARPGITTAIGQLTLAHRPAVRQLGRDVTSASVGKAAKAVAAADIDADVTGQAHAVNLLEALKPLLPTAAQSGIETALAAIAGSLDAQANALAAVEAHAPAALKAQIEAAITAAHAAADDARG
jgi:hypothetical protein